MYSSDRWDLKDHFIFLLSCLGEKSNGIYWKQLTSLAFLFLFVYEVVMALFFVNETYLNHEKMTCFLNTRQPFLFSNLYCWSIVDLQCCVNFCCIAKWFRYIYIHIHIYTYTYIFSTFFSIMVYHRILNIVPCAI